MRNFEDEFLSLKNSSRNYCQCLLDERSLKKFCELPFAQFETVFFSLNSEKLLFINSLNSQSPHIHQN